LTVEFHNLSYLDNWSLLDPASKDYLKTGDSHLDIYLKLVDLASCNLDEKSEEPGIKFLKHFDVILPDFHEFLHSEPTYFGIEDFYKPISRSYVREENSIRCCLEFNYLQMLVSFKGKDQRMQIPHNSTLYDLKQRLNKFFRTDYKVVLTQHQDVLSEISTHFNDKEIMLKQFIDPD
jgi:hypothetical protein